jgi:hypothetical protein
MDNRILPHQKVALRLQQGAKQAQARGRVHRSRDLEPQGRVGLLQGDLEKDRPCQQTIAEEGPPLDQTPILGGHQENFRVQEGPVDQMMTSVQVIDQIQATKLADVHLSYQTRCKLLHPCRI